MTGLVSMLLPNLALWTVLVIGLRMPGKRMRWATMALLLVALPLGPILAGRVWMPAPWVPDHPVGGAAVMVFGAGIGVDDNGVAWPSAASIRRAARGAEIARQAGLPLFVSGGQVDGVGPSEASVIARYLSFQGTLVLDEAARSTWENALAANLALTTQDWQGVVAVTDPLHARRALASLRAADVPVLAYPVGREPLDLSWSDAIPSVAGLAAWGGLGYEWAASVFYMAKGRITLDDLLSVRS